MEKVKVHLSDGSVQTIEGDVTKVIVKDIPTAKEWELKTVNVNGDTEVYDFIGERTSREER